MLKKDFLLFQHDDWTRNLANLRDRLKSGINPRPRQLDEIRRAEEWVAYYAALLRKGYGVAVRGGQGPGRSRGVHERGADR
jgi:hypothetical protein